MNPRYKFWSVVVDLVGIALFIFALSAVLSGCVAINAFRQGVIR